MLRERGLADAKKRAGRAANQGTVGNYMHQPSGYPTVGVIIELASETDFVAKSAEFQKMAHDLAMHVAAAQPRWVKVEDVPAEAVAKEKDLIAREAHASGKPARIIDRIVEGKIRSYYQDHVLYEQKFIRPDQYEGKGGRHGDRDGRRHGREHRCPPVLADRGGRAGAVDAPRPGAA